MGIGTVNASGTLAKSPVTTTTYTLTASNANGSTTASATITVGAMTGTLPVITSFTATPSTIVAGGSSLLQWNIRGNLTSVSIDPEVGVPSNFQQTAEVTPTENTTYTLTATSDNGTVTRSVTVTVQ
jgi:hypothetical protein